MQHLSKKGAFTGKAFAIAFFIVGILIMIFIINHSADVFKTASQGTRVESPSARCVGFLYTISDISSTGEELQFTFHNGVASNEDVHNLTIVGDSANTVQQIIPIGTSSGVRVPIGVSQNFSVYPDGCFVFPAKCSLSGNCVYK